MGALCGTMGSRPSLLAYGSKIVFNVTIEYSLEQSAGRLVVRSSLLRWFLLLLLSAIAVALSLDDGWSLAAIAMAKAQGGAPLPFILIYALASVLFLPGSLLTLAAGALFGPWWGAIYSLTGATLGAAIAFLLARYLAADWVADRLAARAGGRLHLLVAGVEAEGWRFVAMARLVPLLPFNLLNYALGLTAIRFLHYLLATFICMSPAALAYSWLGFASHQAVSGGEGVVRTILIALALLALVIFLPRLIRRLRSRALPDMAAVRKPCAPRNPPAPVKSEETL
jgi:uncharacterized membrane protein YdjX (TVP38/TMEM64 family)